MGKKKNSQWTKNSWRKIHIY